MARRHLQMAIDWKGDKLGVFETRRHYTNYFKGIPHFKEYRLQMVTLDNASEVFEVFDEVAVQFSRGRSIDLAQQPRSNDSRCNPSRQNTKHPPYQQ